MSYKPKVRYFQGKTGIAHFLDQILKQESFDAYFNPATVSKIYPDIIDSFLKQGNKQKQIIRELIVQNKETKKYTEKIKNPQHQYRLLPKKYNIDSDTIIFDNKLALISYTNGAFGILIESPEIVKSQKMAFEIMWNTI